MNKVFEIAQIIVTPPPVVGRGLTLAELGSLIAIVGSFLTNIGVLLAIIAVIVSGIMYMKAGDKEANITKAKSWFKNGIIGTFVILAIGVIINTIQLIIGGGFFGGP